ncbi:DUF4276 family protein [Dickeya undicola]|uniref:DUF4276 family protein n=1 Tax=Dickeya undicola TaxID=1577887 RepID=A0A3N0G0Z1_9GAMM|nr:DUF4276 family protein [Dickeya undicola]RNM05926.1 DUF4276 family protein [Dickeya undicola]RNM25498.1 DUF4276 family protein [Dickeya undicola]
MNVYVEGGGDTSSLRAECRRGFAEFLKKAGLAGSMPRIIACGSRRDAYNSFCTAISQGTPAMLLVDSEDPVTAAAQQNADPNQWQPWLHLRQRQGDGWEKPTGSDDQQCHLMTQCMESWLIADSITLASFFGQGFRTTLLPQGNVERIAKQQVYDMLENATRNTTKGRYGKGAHSFTLLALVDPAKVQQASPWAQRFITQLHAHMSS